jgi:hypothetical protein
MFRRSEMWENSEVYFYFTAVMWPDEWNIKIVISDKSIDKTKMKLLPVS